MSTFGSRDNTPIPEFYDGSRHTTPSHHDYSREATPSDPSYQGSREATPSYQSYQGSRDTTPSYKSYEDFSDPGEASGTMQNLPQGATSPTDGGSTASSPRLPPARRRVGVTDCRGVRKVAYLTARQLEKAPSDRVHPLGHHGRARRKLIEKDERIRKLVAEIQTAITEAPSDSNDGFWMKNLDEMEDEMGFRVTVEAERGRVDQSIEEMPERLKEEAEKDKEVKMFWEDEHERLEEFGDKSNRLPDGHWWKEASQQKIREVCSKIKAQHTWDKLRRAWPFFRPKAKKYIPGRPLPSPANEPQPRPFDFQDLSVEILPNLIVPQLADLVTPDPQPETSTWGSGWSSDFGSTESQDSDQRPLDPPALASTSGEGFSISNSESDKSQENGLPPLDPSTLTSTSENQGDTVDPQAPTPTALTEYNTNDFPSMVLPSLASTNEINPTDYGWNTSASGSIESQINALPLMDLPALPLTSGEGWSIPNIGSTEPFTNDFPSLDFSPLASTNENWWTTLNPGSMEFPIVAPSPLMVESWNANNHEMLEALEAQLADFQPQTLQPWSTDLPDLAQLLSTLPQPESTDSQVFDWQPQPQPIDATPQPELAHPRPRVAGRSPLLVNPDSWVLNPEMPLEEMSETIWGSTLARRVNEVEFGGRGQGNSAVQRIVCGWKNKRQAVEALNKLTKMLLSFVASAYQEWVEAVLAEERESSHPPRIFSLDLQGEIDRQFALYDAKWAHLTSGEPLSGPLCSVELPWPLLTLNEEYASRPIEIRLRDFVLHYRRRGTSEKVKVTLELLKWNPDTFASVILPKVDPKESEEILNNAMEIANMLTTMKDGLDLTQ